MKTKKSDKQKKLQKQNKQLTPSNLLIIQLFSKNKSDQHKTTICTYTQPLHSHIYSTQKLLSRINLITSHGFPWNPPSIFPLANLASNLPADVLFPGSITRTVGKFRLSTKLLASLKRPVIPSSSFRCLKNRRLMLTLNCRFKLLLIKGRRLL